MNRFTESSKTETLRQKGKYEVQVLISSVSRMTRDPIEKGNEVNMAVQLIGVSPTWAASKFGSSENIMYTLAADAMQGTGEHGCNLSTAVCLWIRIRGSRDLTTRVEIVNFPLGDLVSSGEACHCYKQRRPTTQTHQFLPSGVWIPIRPRPHTR